MQLLLRNNEITFNAATDNFYNKFNQNTNYSIDPPKLIPTLYCDIREYALNKGYYNIKNGFLTLEGTWPFSIGKIKVLGFKITNKAHLMEISDNWSYGPVYFDCGTYKGLPYFIKIR